MQLHGGIDNALQIALKNNVALDEDLVLNSGVIYYATDQVNEVLFNETQRTGYIYATSITGASFLITEGFEFIVTENNEKILV